MIKAFGALGKQPYWVIALILGVALVAAPSITVDKTYAWDTHPPTTYWLVAVGIALLILSGFAFGYSLLSARETKKNDIGGGIDLARVKESKGALWTIVGGCEIRVISGRIEVCEGSPGFAIALPCNEYFDARCVDDTRSALGAYANRAFEGQNVAHEG